MESGSEYFYIVEHFGGSLSIKKLPKGGETDPAFYELHRMCEEMVDKLLDDNNGKDINNGCKQLQQV